MTRAGKAWVCARGWLVTVGLFTMTIYHHVLYYRQVQESVNKFVHGTSSQYTANAVKQWFEVQVDAWVDASALHRHKNVSISQLVSDLIHNTYTVINWEHVARAFRADY